MCKKMCVAIFIKCGIMFTEREIFHKKKTIVYNSLGHKKDTSDFGMLGVSQSSIPFVRSTQSKM